MIPLQPLVLPFLLTVGLSGQQAGPGFQRWEIDLEHSTVGFDATSTIHDFTGMTSNLGGGAHGDLSALETTVGGTIWCQVDSLDTGEEDRDENMREDLDVEHFPRISFTIGKVRGNLGAGSSALDLSGTFLIHGVEQARTFPLQVTSLPGGSLHVTGRSRFPMTDHGIEPHSVMGVIRVGAEIESWVDLVLIPRRGNQVVATLIPLQVEETIKIHGSPDSTAMRGNRLVLAGGRAFVDLQDRRVLQTAQGIQMVSLQDLTHATQGSNDAGFQDSRARINRLEAKYQALPPAKREKAGAKIHQTLERLHTAMEAAPPPGGKVETVEHGDRTILRLGERDWVVIEDLQGDQSVLGLFSGLPDLPIAIQEALPELVGIPKVVTIHAATASGARDLVFRFGDATPTKIADWNFTPGDWRRQELSEE